ncbi:TrbI/VirB10 family protein, partial [Brevundimonas diminuta]
LRVAEPADEPVVTDRHATADAVADLPGDYGSVPQLGPPLPGDLGRAILDEERGGDGASLDAGAPPPSAEEQALEAERQRQATQAGQARESGVMVRLPRQAPATAEVAQTGTATAVAPAGAGEGQPGIDPQRDPNGQQRKIDFVAQGPSSTINPHRIQEPASPYQVMAGSVIAASLMTGLRSDLPGFVTAQVSENVYDSATGRILLIPQGARLVGSYDSVVAFGQSRALLVWQRIILPDGASIQLDNLPATDAAGYAGLADKVDFHTWRLLKGVALSTLLGVGTELTVDGESDLVRAVRESTQQSSSQAGQQIVTRNLDVQPTITIRPGFPLRVIVHKDLVLRPWDR